MATKLELTWYGKEQRVAIEPRILIENKELSNIEHDVDTENMLIHGDNLLALKALGQKYAGKIKCIYIDPPYNTGVAFDHYDDNLEHSIWLSLMRERLILLRNLLSSDGLMFIQIDDNEQAYLTVLLDEIFNRNNRLNTICVKMSEPTGVKMAHAKKRMPKLKEYILVYKKENIKLTVVKIPKEKWDEEYKLVLSGISHEDINFIKEIMSEENVADIDIIKADELLKNISFISIEEAMKAENIIVNKNNKETFKFNNAYRIVRDVATTGGAKRIADEKRKINNNKAFLIKTPKNKVYLIKNGYNLDSEQPRIKLLFADDYLMQNPGDLWTDIFTTGLESEGCVEFKKGKKPEKLIQRCIEISTNPGDIVLDSFLGSGTTCAVAHKMDRKWIGIEMGDHAYTHAKVRIDKVIIGEDLSGISRSVNWQGGGGYRFYELAPTLIKEDDFGQEIINPEYNKEMLSAAVALHEGYQYAPDDECYWKQAKNNNSYLYVTTQHIKREHIERIKLDIKDGEFLLVVCKSFESNCIQGEKNIIVKKIPQSLLKNCEFNKDNYNLNIINPPLYEEEEEDE